YTDTQISSIGRSRSPEQLIKTLAARSQAKAIIALLFFLSIVALWNIFQPRRQWEYRTETISDTAFASRMENLGRDGWELVTSRRIAGAGKSGDGTEAGNEMVFKRPKHLGQELIKFMFPQITSDSESGRH